MIRALVVRCKCCGMLKKKKKKVNVVLENVNDHQWPNVQPSRERRYHHLPTSIMGVQESPGLDRRSMMNSMKH